MLSQLIMTSTTAYIFSYKVVEHLQQLHKLYNEQSC